MKMTIKSPEKFQVVRMRHKSSEFRHYSCLGLMVRNEKFCIVPTERTLQNIPLMGYW